MPNKTEESTEKQVADPETQPEVKVVADDEKAEDEEPELSEEKDEERPDASSNDQSPPPPPPVNEQGDVPADDHRERPVRNRRRPQRYGYDESDFEWTGLATEGSPKGVFAGLYVPESYEQAMASPWADYWREAMEEEIKAFMELDVFDEVDEIGRAHV